MAYIEKELKERLRDAGSRLASPPASLDELLHLLDQTEVFLSRVDQSPSQSMSNALCPVMKALVSKELLEHSNTDVKNAVVSCISEVTRITAPDAPYDEDLMKDVFQRTVEAFDNLDDMSSNSYPKMVSILEIVAKVRSCVVMLDLECDDLILDMFRHFLKITSPRHSETVLSSIETIMTLVVEESEDVSPELASCLLHSVKRDREDEFPVSFKLGEKVISNCAAKLKPTLMELVVSTSLDMYSKVVASVCLGRSDLVEHNDLNATEKDKADDNKLSERTVSDEAPQGSAQLDQEVGCPEVGTDPNKSSAMMTSNGTIAVSNGVSTADKIPKEKPGCSQSSDQKSAVAGKQDDSDNMETVNCSKDGSDKALVVPGQRKGHGKGTGSAHADGSSGNQVESSSSDLSKKNDTEHSFGVDNGDLDVVSEHVDATADPTRPKRGRRTGSKSSSRRDADNIAVEERTSLGAKRNEGNNGSQGPGSKKDFDGISDSEGKSSRQSAKDNIKLLGVTVDTVTSYPEPKSQRLADKTGPTRKVEEGSRSKKQQKSNKKQQKKEAHSDGDDAPDLRLKEMVSQKSALKRLGKDKGGLGESSGGLKRKRGQGTEQNPSSQRHKRRNRDGESIVNAKIEVWWQDDEMFYGGVIESFDPISKKHKIVYNDGDIEILHLKDEKWNFIGIESEVEGGRAKEIPPPVAAAEIVQELNSAPENLSKCKGRPKGRPKGRRCPQAIASNIDGSPGGGSKSKGKDGGKVEEETLKTGSTLNREAVALSKDSTIISRGKSGGDGSKADSLSKDDQSKSGRQPRRSTRSIGKSRKSANKGTTTPRGQPKSMGISTPKTGNEPKSNASSGKGNPKVQDSAASGKTGSVYVKAPVPGSLTGKKRRRRRF